MRRLALLLCALPALAVEEDFAFDEGYGPPVSASAVFEPESGKPAVDMGKNKEVKIPPDQRKRRKVTMVFEVQREGGEPRLRPLLAHAGAMELWIVKGVDARALRKALPEGPCFVKLRGDRVLERWYSGGFSAKGEHGRLYAYFPERPLWVKNPQEMGEVQGRILAAREAADSAHAAGDYAGALEHLKALRALEGDWPVDIPPGEERTLRTLEALVGLEKGGDAPFLLSVVEALPSARFDFDQIPRIRALLMERIQGADPALASNLEFQLLNSFRDRFKERSVDTACLDLAEMIALVGGKRALRPLTDYYEQKVLPGPWKDEVKARFAGYVGRIKERARAQTP